MASIVKRSETPFRSVFGDFLLHAYEFDTGREHTALTMGDVGTEESPLVRVQSSCLTGTALGARLCDCKAQLEESLQRIANQGVGCVLYLDQEGRGHGLVEKVAQLQQISEGANTADAAIERGEKPDVRSYVEAAVILRELVGQAPIRLLSNNPAKLEGLRVADVAIADRLAIEPDPTDSNREYLRVKKHVMGHLLSKV